MRKLLVVMTLLALVASQAGAFEFKSGLNQGSFVDFGSSFVRGQEAGRENFVPSTAAPAAGSEIRTVFWVDALKYGAGIVYNDGTNPEITGLIYDLKTLYVEDIKNAGGVTIARNYYYGAAGVYADGSGYTGRIDFYSDDNNDRNGLPPSTPSDPANWVAIAAGNDGTGRDSFPTYSDGTWLFSCTLLPIIVPGTTDPLQIGGEDVLLMQTFFPGSTGATTFYVHANVVDNPTNAPIVESWWLDGVDGIGNPWFYPEQTDLRFFANYTVNDIGGGNIWPQKSNDPVEFKVDNPIPEPTTLALLGTALTGLIPMLRRRSK